MDTYEFCIPEHQEVLSLPHEWAMCMQGVSDYWYVSKLWIKVRFNFISHILFS